jgi:hypothetical protein
MSKRYPTKDDGSPKGLSFGKKIEWVWNYYKGVIIGVIVGVAAIVYFIYSLVSFNHDAITLLAVDVQIEDSSAASDQLAETFNEYLATLDDEDDKPPLEIDNSIYLNSSDMSVASTSMQKLTAIIVSNSANVILAHQDMVEKYGAEGMFTDLKDFLDADTYQKLLDEDALVSVTIPADTETDPEAKDETYYAAIRIDALDTSSLTDAGFYLEDDMLIGIPVNYEHEQRTQAFINMLLDK